MIPFVAIMLSLSALAALVTALAGKKHSKRIAASASFLILATVSAMLALSLISGTASFAESHSYIGALSISLDFRVNAVSLMLLLMSSVVLLAASLSGNPGNERPKTSSLLIELFQISAIGLFSSANLFLFFVFWDIGIVAMFLMINVLGSSNRAHASLSFLVYEIFASAMLLFGIMLIYFHTPLHSLDIQYLASSAGQIPPGAQALIFTSLFLAFMINMPIFPMHFWLPDAHTEASTQGSMLLSGIFTKFGAFGMLLLFTMLPVPAKYAVPIAALASFSAIYAALVLMSQHDIKRIIAYSTIVELGVIMLGIAAQNSMASAGSAFLMFSHGLVVALMFLAVGSMKHIFGERDMRFLKGIVVDARVTTYAFIAGTLATIGFPLTSGFVGDLLIFIGSVQAFGAYGAAALASLLLTGAYLYFVIERAMMSTKGRSSAVNLIGRDQHIGYALLIAFIFLFGTLPFILLTLLK